MAKRHFLQQAHTYNPAKHSFAGWLLSEKLDGQRAFWDGGITRGIAAVNVPWANTAKDKKTRIATGLWSRYGKPIHAPDWWLDKLPPFPLDGELWMGRGLHQPTRSIVSRHIPNEADWRAIRFMIFDSPNLGELMCDGVIDLPNFYKELNGVPLWLLDHGVNIYHRGIAFGSFAEVYDWLRKKLPENEVVQLLMQQQLPLNSEKQRDFLIQGFYEDIVADGGEGIVLRSPGGIYLPERTHDVIKMKPRDDDEATVVGYVTGRLTDKGSKLLGLMGALVVNYKGKIFELSGFTNPERILVDTSLMDICIFDAKRSARMWAEANPETYCPPNIVSLKFPIGSTVTFRYRELSDDGVPKEAAYWRKR